METSSGKRGTSELKEESVSRRECQIRHIYEKLGKMMMEKSPMGFKPFEDVARENKIPEE